jgi:hypothetical protein
LPLIKTWLNKIAGLLRNGNLLKFTKYSMYNFPWSGDSHDYIGYVSNLEGTYEVEFINPSEIRESDNVGGWFIRCQTRIILYFFPIDKKQVLL